MLRAQEDQPMRTRRASAAERLSAVAVALGLPREAVPRAVAAVEASAAAEWRVRIDDAALLARLDAWARAVGVPAESLAVLIVAAEVERREARGRGQRWASDSAGPSCRAGGRSGHWPRR
jgi:hypothetical protein